MRTISLLCSLFLTVVDAQQKRGVVGAYGPRPQKPNIVLILTDDQDVELGSLNFMPKTLKAVKYQGAEFRHAYVTTPMCCPSRSSLLTGMYVHNHNVYTNNDNCSSTTWQTTYETRSFATYLSNAGYRTGYFGKYLNKYNGSYIPPGWREWGGLIMNSKYYNYSINMNGKKIKHGFDYSKDYYPDLVANDSIAFLRQSKKNSAHKPVMLTMSFPSPHGPEDSAPQYSDLFFNVTSHHIPSYDYAPNPDKQWILQVTNKMKPIHKQFTDLLMTKRLQTLQSVDAAVQRVVEELEILGELQNTYIIYTSDHGYHLGQFGLIKGKSFPFEFDVRVPFLIRGPGIDPGAVIDEIVLNIDLAPTFLDIAGVDTPPHMDGRSILPLLLRSKRKKLKWPDTFLIESSGRRETPFLDAKLRKMAAREQLLTSSTTGVTPTYESTTIVLLSNDSQPELPPEPSSTAVNKVYESEEATDDDGAESDHEDDLPDLNEDVHRVRELEMEIQEEEITNQDKPPLKRDNMQLDNRVLPGFIPMYSKFERLGRECSQPNMQKPCSANQKWFCVYGNGRWRKHKCKSIVSSSRAALDNKYRKCACFTPNGLVYKKVSIENLPRRRNFSRIKRDLELDDILFSEFDDTVSDSRNKRNALERVDDTMLNLRGQLNDLQLINTSAIDEQMRSRNLETNLIGDSISGCRILGRGNVNCSNLVYHNKRVWQKSRLEVNNEIQELKEKLEQLKEIRRHLKHYRPEDHEIFGHEDTGLTDPITEHTNAFPKPNRRKHHRKLNEAGRFHRPPKPKLIAENASELATSVNETSTIEDRDETTTEFVKPNKHKHHKHTTPPDERKNSDEIPYPPNNCHCETLDIDSEETSSQEHSQHNRRKLDEEKMRRRARKQRKKESLDKQCSSERMNCFHHDNDHWKTAPLWTNGPFCFCMNSNNNTYSCVRTINITHNFLYCEFTTGLMTFYNLRIDPFELQNRIDQLKPEEKSFLHDQLRDLVRCKGKSCTVNQSAITSNRIRGNLPHRTVENGFHRYRKRKIFPDQIRNGHHSPDGSYQAKHFIKLVNRNNVSHIENKRPISNTTRRKRKHLVERF